MTDLENRVLLNTCYINRIKLAPLSTPSGTVKNQKQLTKAIQGTKQQGNTTIRCYVQNCVCWADLNILGLMGSATED